MHDSGLASIDLNLLVALRALLTERNVTRAAAQLALSQSATSHALARLRELYGDPLLVRSGRRLDLTPRAARLLPALQKGLGELAGTLTGEPTFDPATARRAFTLSMADYMQAVALAAILPRLRQEAPGIELTLVAFPNSLELLDSGAVDLAVLPGASRPAALTSVRLFSDGFATIVRRGHPALARGPRRLSLSAYLALDHLVVAPAGTSGTLVDQELERRGLQRRTGLRVSSFLAAPLLVSTSDVAATGPGSLLAQMVTHYPLELLEPPLRLPRFDLDLVWHSRRDHDPAHAWLRELLMDSMADGAGRGSLNAPTRPRPARGRARRGRAGASPGRAAS